MGGGGGGGGGSDEGTVLGRTNELLVHLNCNLLKPHRNVTKEYILML